MLSVVAATNIAIGTLPPAMVGNATSLFTVCRNLGGAIGIAVMNTQLLYYSSLHLQELTARLDPSRPDVQASLARMAERLRVLGADDPNAMALAQLGAQVQREASVMTYNNLFQFMSVCFMVAMLSVVFMKRPPPDQPPSANH